MIHPAAADTVMVPRLVAALVDDAGLFPPERLPMRAAVLRHRGDVALAHPVLTQRFLTPASALEALRHSLEPAERLRVGLIVDVGLDGLGAVLADVDADPRLTLETVELRLPGGDPAMAIERVLQIIGDRPGTATCIELAPAGEHWKEALVQVARHGLWAKVRCGGVEAAAFPTAAQLADFLVATIGTDTPFKATAGLHHALRYRDPKTGFDHHGFLNLLLATCRAVDGAEVAEVEAALLLDDSADLAAEVRAVSGKAQEEARAYFRAYGSCSTSEPIDDLVALGLLENGSRQ
jgi:hypothetical protein